MQLVQSPDMFERALNGRTPMTPAVMSQHLRVMQPAQRIVQSLHEIAVCFCSSANACSHDRS